MRIRILIGLSILCVTFPLCADAQVRPGAAYSDTARVNGIVLLDPGISLGRAVFLFPASGVSNLPFGDTFNPSPSGGDLPVRSSEDSLSPAPISCPPSGSRWPETN